MDERVSTGEFLSVDPTVPAWGPEVTSVNDSDDNGTWPCYTEVLTLHSLSLLFALVGMAGNSTVLWLLVFRMQRTTFSVYILNLAGADFLVLCVQFIFFWQEIMYLLHDIQSFIPLFFYTLFNFGYLAGLSLLSAISTERCLSVLWPIWHRCQRPRHTSAVVCALLWTASLVFSFVQGYGCGSLFRDFHYGLCKAFNYLAAPWLVVLFVVLFVSSLALLLRVFCGSQRIPVTRLYVTIVLTVLVFLLFGLPHGIYAYFCMWDKEFPYVVSCHPYKLTAVLSGVNSCANPIIYFFVGSFRHHRSQRRTLKLILQRAMQDTPEEGESRDRGPLRNSRELETVSSRC